MNSIFVKSLDEPKFNIKEVIRYMRGHSDCEDLVLECMEECADKLTYNVCYGVFPVKCSDFTVHFPFASFNSADLCKNLASCDRAVVFAATVGLGIDRLISAYGRLSPTKSLTFQAIGAERIESLCDDFCSFLSTEFSCYGVPRPRFSPGYGDLSVEYQRDIFRVLDCYRKIGLSLNDSMLMSPSKSVTAIVGISSQTPKQYEKCSLCNKTDCAFRGGNV